MQHINKPIVVLTFFGISTALKNISTYLGAIRDIYGQNVSINSTADSVHLQQCT
jgi:hypothetical protein